MKIFQVEKITNKMLESMMVAMCDQILEYKEQELFAHRSSLKWPTLMPALKGRLGGVEQSNRFDPERYNVISLQDHIQNGPQRRTVIVAMVLRINVDDKKAEAQKKYNGNARGASTTVQHSRRVLLMCLNSEAGHNTFMMFQGKSTNSKLFDGDLSLRDNGQMRECNHDQIIYMYII